MSGIRRFKQKLAAVTRLEDAGEYDSALAGVEALLADWPGNAHLHVLKASLIQLQEAPDYALDDARQALQYAVELDRGSPAAAIELANYLDGVDDDPLGASKAFADGVSSARRLLIEGLIGQAKALRQLDRRDEFLRCLREVLQLARFERGGKRAKGDEPDAGIIFELPAGSFHTVQLEGPYSDRIRELLGDEVASRTAR